ncbi:MAG: restriction endonuclease subunit S [Bacteroidia bacterium]
MKWKKVQISSFLTERKDRLKPSQANILKLKRVKKIDFAGAIHIEENVITRTNMIIVKKGDLLISGINAEKGAIAIYDYEEDAIATIHYSSYTYDQNIINIEFLKWFLKSNSFKRILLDQVGNGIKSELKAKTFLGLEINLPTLKEQLNIVEKIKIIEQEIEELKNLITENKILLQNLYKTIIQEGIQGTLTSKWRKNSNVKFNSSHLLELARSRKTQLLKEKLIKKDTVTLDKIPQNKPFAIPVNWKWCRFGNIIRDASYGTSQKTTDDNNGVPVLRMGNITSIGDIIFDNLKYISPNHQDLPRLYLNHNDILFNRTNSYDLVGKSAVYKGEKKTYTLASYLIKVTPFMDIANADFLNYYLLSPICRITQIEPQITSQTNQANFSGSKLKNILVPLPPIEEQEIIVKKITSVKDILEEITTHINQDIQVVGQLTKAVLAEMLGEESYQMPQTITRIENEYSFKRVSTYNTKSMYMELQKILEINGKLHAEDLWKMSTFYGPKDEDKKIEDFYAELKKQIEQTKTIKEVDNEKGYLELV